jgi:hypothetical protein
MERIGKFIGVSFSGAGVLILQENPSSIFRRALAEVPCKPKRIDSVCRRVGDGKRGSQRLVERGIAGRAN